MVKQETNFCRVFELPESYPDGFLFEGGKDVSFKMVDFFNPIPQEDIIDGDVKSWEEYEEMLSDFLRLKVYVKPGRGYLLITDFGKSFVFAGE